MKQVGSIKHDNGRLIFISSGIIMSLTGAHLLAAPIAKNTAEPKSRPNIIFILCDDMGYGDLGCYGQKYIRTPNIDNLAKCGIRFTQAYAGSPVSAPSRASLMTGLHSGHCNIRGNKEHWKGLIMYGNNREYAVTGQEPLDPNHTVLPEIMKKNGYNTGMFGKWAGGYEGSVSTPDKRGVDEFFGYICQFQAHLYYPNFLNRYSRSAADSSVVREVLEDNIKYPMYGPEYKKRTQYSADIIHRRALEWIDKQDGETPFYGFLTYTLPHAELAQPVDSILTGYREQFVNDKNWGGSEGSRYNPVVHTHAEFAGMITRLDAYVGEVVAKLKEKGLYDNTIIIFSSDNGPHEEGGADPQFFGRDGKLRGLKRQCTEGGIRVPFIVSWPSVVKSGRTSNLQIAFYDIMPTFCALINDNEYPDKYFKDKLDGISFDKEIYGRRGQEKHDFLYWEFHETDQIAVRKGNWKLLVKRGVPELYNLRDDIHEDNNIAGKKPGIVKNLVKIVMREHTPSSLFKITLPNSEKE